MDRDCKVCLTALGLTSLVSAILGYLIHPMFYYGILSSILPVIFSWWIHINEKTRRRLTIIIAKIGLGLSIVFTFHLVYMSLWILSIPFIISGLFFYIVLRGLQRSPRDREQKDRAYGVPT